MSKRKALLFAGIMILTTAAIIWAAFCVKNSTIAAVLATILGSVLTIAANQFIAALKNGKSQFAGYYRDEIFSREKPDEIIKRDKFQLREIDGKILSGSFKRYVPNDSKYTNWQCSGFIVLDQYLLSYRAVNDTTPSRGVIIVRLDTERTNGLLPCYKGKYYKFEGENLIDHRINLIKIDKEEYLRL